MPKAPLTPPVSEADAPDYAANLRRAPLASTVGSALEYYDFALYGLASALIFSKLFFTSLSPAIGLIPSFAIATSESPSPGSSARLLLADWRASWVPS